jgi:hypothetical protein
MRLLRLLPALALVLLLPAGASAAQPRCDQRAGTTLVADGHWRVYVRVKPDASDPDANVTRIFACRSGSRKTRRLERYVNTLDGTLTPVSGRLAGKWLLMEIDEETGTNSGHGLRLFNLRTHKQRASTYLDGSSDLIYALTDRGAFAVIEEIAGLVAFDDKGENVLAKPGAPASLGASDERIYWMEDGAAKFAVLGAAPTGSLPDPTGAP